MVLLYVLGGAVICGLAILNFVLRKREREGDWDKEGFGAPEHPEPGVHYRRLEVPPHEPFD
jgi:hypothetical protein